MWPTPLHSISPLPSFISMCTCTYPSLQVNLLWINTQVPAVLQSDNGVEFCADIMEALCSLYDVHHITSSIGHPQSQGATERCNREIKDYIRSLLMQMPTIRWEGCTAWKAGAASLGAQGGWLM